MCHAMSKALNKPVKNIRRVDVLETAQNLVQKVADVIITQSLQERQER